MGTSRQHGIEALIGAIYEAAIHPDGWTPFLDLLSEEIGADAAAIHIYDDRAVRGRLGWTTGIPDEIIRGYPHWSARNPHIIACADRVFTGSITPNTPVSREDYLRSDYYNEFMRPHLPVYAATGCCILSTPTLRAVVSADRLCSRPEFDFDVGRLWEVLMPHLQRAATIHHRLADLELERAADSALLDRLTFGVVLLSPRGTAIFENEAARQILAKEDILSLRADGRISCVDSTKSAEFEGLIASACEPRPPKPAGGCIRLQGTSEPEPVEVFVAPLRLRELPLVSKRPAAVVFIRGSEDRTASLARMQKLFNVTAAEAKVAQFLMSGLSVNEIAETSGSAVPTIRTHVRQLLAKVGAATIYDLTRRLARILPVR